MDSLLADWLDANKHELDWLDAVVHRANEILEVPDHAIGPAFFLKDDLSEETIQTIWERMVLPYLDEFLHGADGKRGNLTLSALRIDLAAQPGATV